MHRPHDSAQPHLGLLVAQSRFSPRMLLLAGLALSTLLSALMAPLLASGHPLVAQLPGWLSGSTYHATLPDAALAGAAAVLAAGLATGIGTVWPAHWASLVRWPQTWPPPPEAGARTQLPAAAGLSAALVLIADRLGRVGAILWQPPAGLVALPVGGAALTLFLWRKPR